jgi:hypothetical protein
MCVALLAASALFLGADAGRHDECARGDELRRAGNMRAALAAYKTCVDGGGGDAVMRHNLGVALVRDWLGVCAAEM